MDVAGPILPPHIYPCSISHVSIELMLMTAASSSDTYLNKCLAMSEVFAALCISPGVIEKWSLPNGQTQHRNSKSL